MATIESFVPILDLGGTFVFAISGAVAAVNRRLVAGVDRLRTPVLLFDAFLVRNFIAQAVA
ncbi:MAG: hypothetical protein WB611_02780 [Stellaceae bacterium]